MANLDIIIRAVDQASGTIDGIGGKLGSLAGTATKMVAGAGVAAIGAFTAAVGVSVSKAADMEQRVADIASVMGLAKDATQPLADLITDLGLDPQLKVSAVEAASAIEALATGGVSMTEILDGAARSTVLLANSTGADFGQAATIATDVMSLFNIGAGDMMKAVDGITGVTVASKFGINDYALALAQGGGVASAVGVSFDDFNTTIAAISPYFSSGADAGTSFKTFLQRLVPTTDSARGAMAELGLITAEGGSVFYDSSGNMKDMQEIAGLLQGAIGGLSEEQKNQYLSTIFGTDAMRAAIGLAEAGSGTFDTLAASIASTSAEMSAATRMDTFKGAWEILTGVIDTLSIELGNVFLPVFRDVIEWLTALAQTYGPAAIAWVEDMIGWVQDIIPVIKEWGDTLWGALQDVKDWVSGSDEQMVILKGLWDGVITFLEEKLPEWAKIIGDWASESWLWLVDVALPKGLEALGKYAGALIDYLTANAPAWVGVLAGWADSAWKWIIDIALPTAVEKLGDFAQGLFSWMSEHLPGWLAVLRDWAVAAAVWILDAAADLLVHAATVLGKLTDWMNGEGQGNLGTSLAGWVSAMWRWVADELWPKLEPALKALGAAMLLLLGSIGELLWAAVKSLGANLVAAIQAGITEAWDAFKTWLSTTWNTIADPVRNLGETLKNLGASLVAAIQAGITAAWGAFKAWLSTTWNTITEPVRKLGDTFRGLGAALLQGFRDGISRSWSDFSGWFQGKWTELRDWFSSFWKFGSPSKVMEQYGEWIMEGLRGGIDSRGQNVVNALAGWTNSLQEQASNSAQNIANTLAGDQNATTLSNTVASPTAAALYGATATAGSAIPIGAQAPQSNVLDLKNSLTSLGRQIVQHTQAAIANAMPEQNTFVASHLNGLLNGLLSIGAVFDRMNGASSIESIRSAFEALSEIRNRVNMNVAGLLQRQELVNNYTINVTGNGEAGQDVINAVQYLQGLTV